MKSTRAEQLKPTVIIIIIGGMPGRLDESDGRRADPVSEGLVGLNVQIALGRVKVLGGSC